MVALFYFLPSWVNRLRQAGFSVVSLRVSKGVCALLVLNGLWPIAKGHTMKLKHLKAVTILSAALAMPLLAPGDSSAQSSDAAESASEHGQARAEGRRGRGGHGRRGHRGHGRNPMRMFEGLDLSDAQRTQLEGIFESHREEFEALHEAGRSEENRAARRALRDEVRSEVEAVLTAEQQAALETRHEARRERRGRRGHGHHARRGHAHRGHGHHGRGHGHGHMRRALESLELSDNQEAQIEAILESARERRHALREGGHHEETRASMHELREETRGLIDDVLTTEQRAQLEAQREAHQAERRAHRIERLTERHDLTPAQVTRVTQILESADEARRSAMRNENPREALEVIRERTRSAIREVVGE